MDAQTHTKTRLNGLTDAKQAVLRHIKRCGSATVKEVSAELGISSEGARQHLVLLAGQGWIERNSVRPDKPRLGRPTVAYALTPAGEELFPKQYDDLALNLLDTILEAQGEEILDETLASLTDRKVAAWRHRVANLELRDRLEVLKGFYGEDDGLLMVLEEDDEFYLVETNCPIRSVAVRFPKLCSTSISALSRLIGYQIERTRKFQNGDGRCVFRVRQDHPVGTDEYRLRFEE